MGNLASFVSLAEAYVPTEWKALALFTGNCTYMVPHTEVLKVVNRTAELESRGLATIMLQPDGTPFPSTENRISLGSRGDSFYEYLLKDNIFAGGGDKISLTRNLWRSFRIQLPSLLVEANPAAVMAEMAVREAALAEQVEKAKKRKKRRRRRKSDTSSTDTPSAESVQSATAEVTASKPRNRKLPPPRGSAGAGGGWFENWRDVTGNWVFLKEVGYSQTIPKIDHLVCFLPGAFALDVIHNGLPEEFSTDKQANLTGLDMFETSGNAKTISAMQPERISELYLAHKLLQTCVHMYFRTATDLAPEITRFNGLGLTDDLGSMHNILRPETIESVFLMWRTTKAQIYRNWGQRILAAFSRMKAPYGYAGLHNVNKPWEVMTICLHFLRRRH